MKTEFKPGDILPFSGTSCLSRGIQACTLGAISHVGILANDRDGVLRLYEALLEGGVQRNRWQSSIDWTIQLGGKVWHYSLARPLSVEESGILTAFLEDQVGKPYDKVGALRARTLGFGWARHLCSGFGWLPSRVSFPMWFCNDLAGEGLKRVNRFHTRNPSKYNPTSFCRTLRWRGIVAAPRIIVKGRPAC